MDITAKDVGIYEYAIKLIDQETLALYLGIDVNQDLLKQSQEIFSSSDKIIFQEGDFSQGLKIKEDPFDIYFTSFGTLSHNHDDQTVKLLSDIAEHSKEHSLVICDWLGRYSYEWQELWSQEPNEDKFMDYRISYIYPPEEREIVAIKTFPLRFLSKGEALNIVQKASENSGIDIKVRKIFDRSIFVGRHMDTAEYNSHCLSIRQAVNSLLEPNTRTDLSTLIIDYIPKRGFTGLNKFFEGFSVCWNTLIGHTMEFLSEFNEKSVNSNNSTDLYTFYPESLKETVETMKEVITTAGNLPGDSRANIIEPQLAFALRKLEMDTQPGEGAAHGLIGILEINK